MSQKSPEVKPDGHAAYLKRVVRSSRIPSKSVQLAEAVPAWTVAEGGAERHPPALAAGTALGNNTKSQAVFEVREHENPDCIQRFTLDESRREYVEVVDDLAKQIAARQGRFSAQGSASRLLHAVPNPRTLKADLGDWDDDDGVTQAPLKQWRVTGCSRRRIAEKVVILHSASLAKANFGNLMICGSVWTCPVCSAKISEGRKREIQAATDLHCEAGGFMYMVTFTFSHQRHDDIRDLLMRFAKARKWMREHRSFKDIRRKLGCIGDIRTLEVTHGNSNGWHPHEHGLWLVATELTREKLRDLANSLFELWKTACKRVGLGAPNRKRGVNIIKCESAADYLAKTGRHQKWGVGSELSKQHVKKGKLDGRTPFDLLRSYEAGDARDGALFIEYAKAFFGKRQIMWSKGLKAIFGIAVKQDQDIAEEQLAPDAVELVSITAYEWRVVLHQPYDVRSQLLLLAEVAGREGVRSYVDRLCLSSNLIPF